MDSDQPAAAPVAAEPSPPVSSAAKMIEELYARRHNIKTLLVATIDTDNNCEVEFSIPAAASAMAHLWRMMDVKLDRFYLRGMTPPPPPGPPTGVRGNSNVAELPRKTRRKLAALQRKAHKARRP